jgi:hypothetical protein
MSFVGWLAIIGWAIVIVQNGFTVTKWIIGKVKEAKELKP